jgi:hypothetical protein
MCFCGCHGLKLPPQQRALYEGIDEILWREWDPIGISELEDAPRDEYYGYLPQVQTVSRDATFFKVQLRR